MQLSQYRIMPEASSERFRIQGFVKVSTDSAFRARENHLTECSVSIRWRRPDGHGERRRSEEWVTRSRPRKVRRASTGGAWLTILSLAHALGYIWRAATIPNDAA